MPTAAAQRATPAATAFVTPIGGLRLRGG
eukprot:ctg_6713.g665